MPKTIRVASHLPFHAPLVWSVLTDLSKYPDWNPQFVTASGTMGLGQSLRFRVNPPSGKGQPYDFAAKITEFVPERSLAWEGGMRPVLWGRHFFTLEPEDDGVRLIHGEDFQGVYPFWIGQKGIDQLRPAYEAANFALSERLTELNVGGS